MSARRGMNQVVDDVVDRALWGAASGASQLGIVADKNWQVAWTHERRVLHTPGGDAQPPQDAPGDLPNARALPAGHIVHLSRLAALEEPLIGFDHVGDMQKIPDRSPVAHAERPAGGREVAGTVHERRQQVGLRMTDAGMVEAARADDRDAGLPDRKSVV